VWAVQLYDVPHILGCMAELAACNAGAEIEVADSDRIVLDVVGKIVIALGHSSDENANAFILVKALDVVGDSYYGSLETQCDLPAVRWEMVGDGVFDHVDELLLRGSRADLVPMEELHHQTSKALECPRNAHRRANLNEDVLRCLYVYLEFAGLVNRRVKQGEETLVCDIWASFTDVSAHLPHHPDVVIAVEKSILVISSCHVPAASPMGHLVALESGIAEDNNQPLGALIA